MVAELTVSGAIPVEVRLTGRVAEEPSWTKPKVKLVGLTSKDGVSAGAAIGAKVAICMTQGPDDSVAVGALLPAVVVIMSSARSLSGEVIIRAVKPLPAPVVAVEIVSAPKISSLAIVVVAGPLLAVAPLPLAPAVTSRALTPLYSRMRMSG